ncbi:MAG: hypothetical protein LIO42_04535 [Oscillospiraceae bacterium]|nr:hypothetical protein [Oscillospiraceae bacterium]
MQNTAYKQNRAYTTVHKKLMAAIAMLLIASILLATTTYAWYVLSTAPEVTGITTTVGSNGALEIALVNDAHKGSAANVSSSTGDSMATSDATVSNITWGNLVDLSDSFYGFSAMTLNLATYDSTATATTLATLLSYPQYGADGRVSKLISGMTAASYDPTSGTFLNTEGSVVDYSDVSSYYGVRALGVSSSTSVYETALKTQQTAVTSAAKAATKYVPNAMNDELLYILLLAVDYTKDSTAAVSSTSTDYRTTVDAIITAMENTNSKLEAAMKAAILAYVASDTELYDSYYTALNALDFDALYTAALAAETDAGVDLIPDEVTSVYTTYDSLVTATTSAREAYDLLDDDSTLAELKTALGNLMDISYLTFKLGDEDVTIDELKTYNETSLVAAILQNGITITLADGGGALYDLAALIGNYTATANGYDVTFTTAYNSTAAMDTLKTTVAKLQSDYIASSRTDPVTDIYGYVMDFWFRTNADSADLLLQTEAATRIANEDDTSVQGAGSYVQFADYDEEDENMVTLAGAVKLLFLNDAEDVIATASISEIDTDGKGWLELDSGYDCITTLLQNEAQQISVVVYIDGEEVDNTMVSADSTLSFTMNLQFSTDTTLQPMTYSSEYARLDGTTGG